MNNEKESASKKLDFNTNKVKEQFDIYVTELLQLRVRAENENPHDIVYKMKHMLGKLEMALEKFEHSLKVERQETLWQEFYLKEPGHWEYCHLCGTKVDDPAKRTGACRTHTHTTH